MSTEKGLGLLLARDDRKFAFSFGSTPQASSVLAKYTNEPGEEIDLVTGLINLIADTSDALDPETVDLQGLTTIFLHEIEIRYDRFPDKSKQYGIKARVSWKPDINFWSDDSAFLDVTATVELLKRTGERVTGEVCGLIQTPIEGLEFLKLGACLRLEPQLSAGAVVRDTSGKIVVDKNTYFLVSMGEVTFSASFNKTDTKLNLIFGIEFPGKLTLGDVITFFASLVDPSIEEYEFDPPWDFLSKFDLGSFLRDLQLTFTSEKNSTTTTNTFGFRLATPAGLIPSELQPFLNVSSFGLGFTSTKMNGQKKSTKKTNILITGSFLGKTFSDSNPLKWDPVDGKPPEIPGKGGAIFDLRYLGLGQHVAFTQTAEVRSIKDVMNALRGTIDANQSKLKADRSLSLGSPQDSFLASDNPIGFSAESEWLVGLEVSLLKMLNLSLIFNDPVIYGLRIELYGEAAKNFKGFVFEILYTKVSDTIGKYHGELVLPDLFRRMEFGAVTVIMPGIIVDVYTNGDFGVDLGFPHNFNYSLSFGMEIFPFVGAGGFYFRKLSAETATSTPVLHNSDKGVFTPVYEFGIGLRLGLGKSFEKGPLKAEISITLQGMIEGVISWYRPANGVGEHQYYKLSGGIRIVGRLYGAVDFVVISVEIEVIAEASIRFILEIYKDIQIMLEARVSVSATVKIAFVKVKKKFEMTVKQEFTIASPSGYDTPWLVA